MMHCCSIILDQKGPLIHLYLLLKWVCLNSRCLRCQLFLVSRRLSVPLPLGISDQLRAVIIKSTPGQLGISDQLRLIILSFWGNMPLTAVAVGLHSQHRPQAYIDVNVSRPYFSTRPQGTRKNFGVWGRN